MDRSPVCLVIGAGDGLGAAVAHAFAQEGLTVCLTRRPRHVDKVEKLAAEISAKGGSAHAFGIDAREEESVIGLFNKIERNIGEIDVVVFNVGANVRFPITETSSRVYSKTWEMGCFAGFLAGREAARVMTPRKKGTILFTGATASVRGGAGFSAFSGAKHGLRALAQGMSRELGPQGIHVAHIVIDGAMDGAFVRSIRADVDELLEREEILKPTEVARNYVWLWKQGRSAWTHELDLRPWSEKW